MGCEYRSDEMTSIILHLKRYTLFKNHRLVYCPIHARNIPPHTEPSLYVQSPSTERMIINQYCLNCDAPVCDDCLLYNCFRHKVVDLNQQAAISKQQLQAIREQKNVIIKLIDEQANSSDKYDQQSIIDIKTIKSRINIIIDAMISKISHTNMSKLNHQRQELFNSLDKIQERKEKIMMTVHDGHATTKATMASLETCVDDLLIYGSDYDMVKYAPDIQSDLVALREAKIPSFMWSLHDTTASPKDDMAVAEISMTTDTMDTEDVDVLESEAIRDNLVSMTTDTMDTDAVDALGSRAVRDNVVSRIYVKMRKRGKVGAMEVMEQTLFVVYNSKPYLYTYPVSSSHKPQKLSIKGLPENPFSIVRLPPGQSQLVISSFQMKKLLWIKLKQRSVSCKRRRVGWKVTSIEAFNVSYEPLYLGVHHNQLLVCDDTVIHVLSTSGEEKHIVNMPQGVRPRKAVAQLTSPGFVIMDRINRQVVLVTEEGELQHRYQCDNGFHSGDIVCHGHSIYVTNYGNDRADEFGVDGRYVRQMIRYQRVKRPVSMCVDDTGRLYVMQCDFLRSEVLVIEPNTQCTPADRIQECNMKLSVTWYD